MRRSGAELAKIVRAVHQAAAEMIMPDPVDHRAPGQGMTWLGQPGGQGCAPLPFRGSVRQLKTRGQIGHAGKGPRLGCFPGLENIPSLEQVNWTRTTRGLVRAV